MTNTSDKIKLVVLDEHTLGYIQPGSNYMGVLHASVLRGSSMACPLSAMNPILIGSHHNVRLATREDFDVYRCHFSKVYENEGEYEYQK